MEGAWLLFLGFLTLGDKEQAQTNNWRIDKHNGGLGGLRGLDGGLGDLRGLGGGLGGLARTPTADAPKGHIEGLRRFAPYNMDIGRLSALLVAPNRIISKAISFLAARSAFFPFSTAPKLVSSIYFIKQTQ